MADPTLELRDSNGALLIANDNWQDDSASAAQLIGHGLAPLDSLESGIFAILPPGAFTAILAGKDGGVGLGLVEVYNNLPAATLTVTSMADSEAGSLRDTIAAARDGDTIQDDSALNGQEISLTSDELVIDKNITIRGPGPNGLEVSRASLAGFRIFHIMPGRTVTIEGLTISNGFAGSGGGIFSDHATLTISNCSVENNVAEEQGGGIYNDGGVSAPLKIVNTSVTSNGAFGKGLSIRGGGIYNKSGALEILHRLSLEVRPDRRRDPARARRAEDARHGRLLPAAAFITTLGRWKSSIARSAIITPSPPNPTHTITAEPRASASTTASMGRWSSATVPSAAITAGTSRSTGTAAESTTRGERRSPGARSVATFSFSMAVASITTGR